MKIVPPGPHGRITWHTVNGKRVHRYSIRESGRQFLTEWLKVYPIPGKLYHKAYRSEYSFVSQLYDDDEINSACLQGAARAVITWRPKVSEFVTYACHYMRAAVNNLPNVVDYERKKKHQATVHHLSDVTIEKQEGKPDAIVGRIADLEQIEELLRFLPYRQADVLIRYYGIGTPKETLEQLGKRMHMSKERVRQLKERSIESIQERIGIE